MDADRKRQLKALGKAEVERRSAKMRESMAAANPAQVGTDAWVQGYKAGTERERWLRARLPILHHERLESMFVVRPYEGAGWVPHRGGYVCCVKCGSAVPTDLPRRLFFWSGCACGNIRWRCAFFLWRKVLIDDLAAIQPVKLTGKA